MQTLCVRSLLLSMEDLRSLRAGYVLNSALAAALGLSPKPNAAAEAEKVLSSPLSKIETCWLKESGRFLLGGNQPSIADLSLVCKIMQLEVLDENDHIRILGPHKKVQQWIEDTRNATKPQFDEKSIKPCSKLKQHCKSVVDKSKAMRPGLVAKRLNICEKLRIDKCAA